MIGMDIKTTIGVGDALQFSSLPENYYRATGHKLLDMSQPWFFDHNPYVIRQGSEKIVPNKVVQMWNFCHPDKYEWPIPRHKDKPKVYLSNAEIWASLLNVPVVMNRPRLYRFEEFPYEERQTILFHIDGRSHGMMPEHIIDHVLKKYSNTRNLYQIGTSSRDLGIPKLKTSTLWDLAAVISKAKMLIGVDSGPSWIAACYPDVVVKKLRTKPSDDVLKTWVPLEIHNIHSHWDDRCHQIFNVTEDDIGFTYSYRKI